MTSTAQPSTAQPLAVPAPAGNSLIRELRAAHVVWKREMIRFLRSKGQIAISLIQPLAYLLALGTGLSTLMHHTGTNIDYRTYLFPGVLVMTVQAPALAAGISIVWDREVGFLREMLVAPVSRTTLLAGKCLAGTTIATTQGALVLALAWYADIPYHPGLIATLLAEMALIALAMTTLGAAIAVSVTRVQTFQTVLSFALLPMTFLSGAMFPLTGMPAWVTALTLINPLRYAVDPPHHAIAAHLPPQAQIPATNWQGWQPPVALELTIVAALALAALGVAVRNFARTD